MHIFVVIAFGVFQLMLPSHFSVSVHTITTLKSHTEKNDEYCLVCEALLIDKKFGNIFGQNFLVRRSCNTIPRKYNAHHNAYNFEK